ncbi:acetate--CoA ligase family protein [Candidatus Bathyarchaeota archaeon]|nr:acetate--CoA ligase family protein [Candidatus Bathyarchaeota archaeon]
MSEKIIKIFEKVKADGRKFLLEHEAKSICKEYGIPTTSIRIAKNVEDAIKFSEEIDGPTVFKIISPDVIHKFDVGGVILNIITQEDAKKAYNKILENIKKNKPEAKIEGILIQEMAPSATEVIVGAIKDAQFGPTLMFGFGGTFVEIMKDVSFRIAPITKEEAKEMISEVKAYPILKGYRGQPPADIEKLAEIILNTSRLVMDHQEIKELDLNPVMVYENGVKTVDARIIIE